MRIYVYVYMRHLNKITYSQKKLTDALRDGTFITSGDDAQSWKRKEEPNKK